MRRMLTVGLPIAAILGIAMTVVLTGCTQRQAAAPANPPSSTAAPPPGAPPGAAPAVAQGPGSTEPYVVVTSPPPKPAIPTHRHRHLTLVRRADHDYLWDGGASYYDVGRTSEGDLYPAYHDQAGHLYRLYYDPDRDMYYRVARDDYDHANYRQYEGDPDGCYYVDNVDYSDRNRLVYYEPVISAPHRRTDRDAWLLAIPLLIGAYILLQPSRHVEGAGYRYERPWIVRQAYRPRSTHYPQVYFARTGTPGPTPAVRVPDVEWRNQPRRAAGPSGAAPGVERRPLANPYANGGPRANAPRTLTVAPRPGNHRVVSHAAPPVANPRLQRRAAHAQPHRATVTARPPSARPLRQVAGHRPPPAHHARLAPPATAHHARAIAQKKRVASPPAGTQQTRLRSVTAAHRAPRSHQSKPVRAKVHATAPQKAVVRTPTRRRAATPAPDARPQRAQRKATPAAKSRAKAAPADKSRPKAAPDKRKGSDHGRRDHGKNGDTP